MLIVSLILVALAIGIGFAGYQLQHPGMLDPLLLVGELYTPVASALLAAGITVFILGSGAGQRARRQERNWLVRQLRSSDNALALDAVESLRERGVLFSGALNGVTLTEANLQRAYLLGANLQGANLSRANLAGAVLNGTNLRRAYLERVNLKSAALRQANLRAAFLGDADVGGADFRQADMSDAILITEGQLAILHRLRGATMPDGSRYDGRYRLEGDLADALAQGGHPHDAVGMAAWYGVDPGVYTEGQRWANDNLAAYRTLVSEVEAAMKPGVTGEWDPSQLDTPSTQIMDIDT